MDVSIFIIVMHARDVSQPLVHKNSFPIPTFFGLDQTRFLTRNK
uniref:Uncharacterized protein n=1 Tax=Manihot esculenta TaxID=3983 RepID=A0A2C9UJL7_MANES